MQRANAYLVVAFCAGMLSGTTLLTRADVGAPVREPECGAASGTQLRTTLYFGLGRPKGTVSELEWQLFVRDEVTPRFPAGLTVWPGSAPRRDGAASFAGMR